MFDPPVILLLFVEPDMISIVKIMQSGHRKGFDSGLARSKKRIFSGRLVLSPYTLLMRDNKGPIIKLFFFVVACITINVITTSFLQLLFTC